MICKQDTVDTVERLSMWNIRIWGNCFNCIGPDWAKQLIQLNASFIALLKQLDLEALINVAALVSLATDLKDKLGKLDEVREDVKRMRIMMEQNTESRSTVWNNSVGGGRSSSGGGGGGGAAPAPALGLVYQKLFDVAMQLNEKSTMFIFPLERFKSALQCSQPVIEEITKDNRVLHLTEEEEEKLTKQLESGVQLVQKYSKVRQWRKYKKKEYTTKIMSLNNTLQRLFIRFKVQLERKIKETLDSTNKIEAMIKIIEACCAVQIDDMERKGRGPSEFVRVQQFNKLVDSTRNRIDQKGVKSNDGPGSNLVQEQMETAVGLDVLSLQGSMDVEPLNSTETNIYRAA